MTTARSCVHISRHDTGSRQIDRYAYATHTTRLLTDGGLLQGVEYK